MPHIMRPIATMSQSVCRAKMREWSRCHWLRWAQGTIYKMGVQMPHGKRHFSGIVPAYCNVPTWRCACARQAYSVDECIRQCEGWQDGNADCCQITLDTS